jgi:hypothetical protein
MRESLARRLLPRPLPLQRIVPVFMAEHLDEKQRPRMIDQCRQAGVRLGYRTGRDISITARMPQAAKPGCGCGAWLARLL